MKLKFLISTVLVALTLAACAPRAVATQAKHAIDTAVVPVTGATATATAGAQPTATTASAGSTKAPAPTAIAVFSPVPTTTPGPGLISDILVHDQSIQSGSVLVSLVDAMKPGWVAIFTDDNGKPGTLLGHAPVQAGTTEDLKVQVDPQKATGKMLAVLLVDAGKIGTFEYPGPDEPVKNTVTNTDVMATFSKTASK